MSKEDELELDELDEEILEGLDDSEGARSFLTFLLQLASGECAEELSVEWHKLITKVQTDALRRVGSSTGELTLKLKIKADARRQAAIAYDIKVKEPPKVRPGAIMYVTKGGNLTVDNPRQQSLPLREVNQPTKEARDVGEAAAAREV